jgi:hypothetical protein
MIKVKSSSKTSNQELKGWVDVLFYSVFNFGASWGVADQRHAQAVLSPKKLSRYPRYRRLGVPQG